MRFLAATCLMVSVPVLAQQSTTWRFDHVTRIGNTPVTTVGHPKTLDTPIGVVVHFDGQGHANPGKPESGSPAGDALLVDASPLSGAATYTFEVIFRPSSKGAPAQRFFHLQDRSSQSRRMFEIRIVQGQWCLDTVAIDAGEGVGRHGVTLACDAAHLHPLDRWYAVAATYDGTTLRGYVDGSLQGEVGVKLAPLAPGRTSVGTRIDQRDFFTGDVYAARFTDGVLETKEFLSVPREGGR